MQHFDRLTIHLISHNHWDREWIFTAKHTNRWLLRFFENLFKRLAEQPEYRFVLDGQTLMIEDYLNLLPHEEAQEKEKLIRHYVQKGQLLVGPAYLQPDWSLVSGEALVRNLLIGYQMASQLGGVMKIGWMLDNFGQIAQAPQICKGFGIEGAFVWRGIGMPPDQLKSEFWWKAPNGQKILAVYLINSYRNAMVLSLTREIAKERIISQAEALRPFATTPNVLLMNGYEQVPWPDDILPIIESVNREIEPQMHCIQSTPPDYLQAVLSHNPELPELDGYFYSGRYAPILKGVFSSRSHLNLLNNECQRELERWAEPFSAFAWAFGGEYPHRKLMKAWKTLLLNHTHDDICGCCVDTIARDMEERFHEVLEIGRDVSAESLRTIAQTVDTAVNNLENPLSVLVVFNPSPHHRSEVVGCVADIPAELEKFSFVDSDNHLIPHQVMRREGRRAELYLWAEKIPSLSYKCFYLIAGNRKVTVPHAVRVSKTRRTLENKYLRVKINKDGTLNVLHKATGVEYRNLVVFENGGDAGDTYDYSYPPHDEVITSQGKPAKIELDVAGPLVARFKITQVLKIPRSLTKDRQTRSKEKVDYPIVTYVELTAGGRHVEMRTVVINNAKDHRLRVLFPTNIQAETSFAEEPYDVAEFPLQEPEFQENVPEKFKGLMLAGRYPKPINTRPFQNFVGLKDAEKGLTIISRRLTEYEILEGGTIAVTLLRSVGWLARDDLLTRVGDVGPHIFTPEAQCLGKHVFAYAIYPHVPDWSRARPHFESDVHNTKMRVVQTDVHKGKLPPRGIPFLEWQQIEPDGAFRMTSMKLAENGSDIIFRFYNTLNVPACGCLRQIGRVAQAFLTDLKEDILAELPQHDSCITIDAKPKEIISIRLKLDRTDIVIEPDDEHTVLLPLVFPPEDAPEIPLPPVITRQEVHAEQQRARQLKAKLSRMRNQVFLLEDEIERTATRDIAKLTELQKLKGEVATLTRQLYECRISALLNHELYIMKSIENQLDEMGEEMSWSRIKKRVGEYLIHYYERLLETQNSPKSG